MLHKEFGTKAPGTRTCPVSRSGRLQPPDPVGGSPPPCRLPAACRAAPVGPALSPPRGPASSNPPAENAGLCAPRHGHAPPSKPAISLYSLTRHKAERLEITCLPRNNSPAPKLSRCAAPGNGAEPRDSAMRAAAPPSTARPGGSVRARRLLTACCAVPCRARSLPRGLQPGRCLRPRGKPLQSPRQRQSRQRRSGGSQRLPDPDTINN